jgi:hypothetical protein
MLTLVAYRFMVGGLVPNASCLTRLMEIEHAPGIDQSGHIRPNVGMRDQRLQAGLNGLQMACGRWLELRLTPRAGRLDGAVFMSALLVVGFILLFYRETLVSSG